MRFPFLEIEMKEERFTSSKMLHHKTQAASWKYAVCIFPDTKRNFIIDYKCKARKSILIATGG